MSIFLLTVRLPAGVRVISPFSACSRVVYMLQYSLSYLNVTMLRDGAESSYRSTDRPVFPMDTDGRVLARWCETMALSGRIRTARPAEYREWIRSGHDVRSGILVPEHPRLGEVPAIIARVMRDTPPDRLSALAARRLGDALHEAMEELASRIATSERPRTLKRAMGRYRRLAEALGHTTHGNSARIQTSLSRRPRESGEVTVHLIDERIARACLEAFYEIWLSHARRTLVSSAMNITRAEAEALRRADLSGGRETFFRCDRSELSIRPIRLADIFALSPARGAAPVDVDRTLRTLVLELAAYPWEAVSADAGAPAMVAEKRMGCVGKSLLLHSFLEHLGIEHRVLDMFDHSAVVSYGPTGRSYLDPVNFVSPVPLPDDPQPIGSCGYESLPLRDLPAPMRAARSVSASAGITAQMLANIAAEYARCRQYRDALALLAAARSLVPDSAALLGLSGRVARLSGDAALAREYLELAVERCPQDVRSSRELAGMLLSDGRYARAKALYSGVVAREGAPAWAWYDYGVACTYDRDDDRAIDAFDRVLADDPDHVRALDLRFHIVRAIALERGRRFQAGG